MSKWKLVAVGLAGVAAVTLALALSYPDLIGDEALATLQVRGGSPGGVAQHITLNEGTARDAKICIDTATAGSCNESFGWSDAGQGFAITKNLIYNAAGAFGLYEGSGGYYDLPKKTYDGLTTEQCDLVTVFSNDFNATGVCDPWLSYDGTTLVFGPASALTLMNFGQSGNTSDTAFFRANMIFDSTDSDVFGEFRLDPAGSPMLRALDGFSGGSTSYMWSFDGNGTNMVESWYTPGAGTVDYTLTRSAADTHQLDGASFKVTSPGVVMGDRIVSRCDVSTWISGHAYCGVGPTMSATRGVPLPKVAGSLMGASTQCLVSSCFGCSGTITTTVEINGSGVFNSTSSTISADGVYTWGNRQARGVDTFAATPDWWAVYIDSTLSAAVNNCFITTEWLLDN